MCAGLAMMPCTACARMQAAAAAKAMVGERHGQGQAQVVRLRSGRLGSRQVRGLSAVGPSTGSVGAAGVEGVNEEG